MNAIENLFGVGIKDRADIVHEGDSESTVCQVWTEECGSGEIYDPTGTKIFITKDGWGLTSTPGCLKQLSEDTFRLYATSIRFKVREILVFRKIGKTGSNYPPA